MSGIDDRAKWGAGFLILVFLLSSSWITISTIILSLVFILSCLVYFIVNEKPAKPPRRRVLKFCDASFKVQQGLGSNRSSELLFPENEPLSKEIELLLDNIVKNFIESWFHSISESDNFPNAVKSVLSDAIVRLSSALSDVDLCQLLILKILPLLTKHYTTFYISQETITSGLSMDKPEKDVDFAVAVEFNKQYRIHKALTLTLSQEKRSDDIQKYSRKMANDLLKILIDPKELKSPFVRPILREIVTCSVLQVLVEKISNPDFWNTKLIDICSQVLKERSQITELRAVLSKTIEHEDVNSISDEGVDKNLNIDVSAIYGVEEEYESFLKQLSSVTGVNQLTTMKVRLWIEALRMKKDIEEHDSPKIEKKYAGSKKRIYLALDLIDSKLSFLLPYNSDSIQSKNVLDQQLANFQKFIETITVQDILSSTLSSNYVMSFLESSSDKSGAIDLQLWLFIEHLRNPLEDILNDEIQVETSNDIKEDLKELYTKFLTTKSTLDHLMHLDPINVKTIKEFVESNDDLSECSKNIQNISALEARKSMLLLQKMALKSITDNWFPKFKSSELFFQMLSDFNFIKEHIDSIQSSKMPNDNVQADTVKLITHGDLGKALDDILNHDTDLKVDGTKEKVAHKKSFSNLFGNETESLFQDGLFGDTSINEDDHISETEGTSFDPYSVANSSQESLSGSNKMSSSTYNDSNIINYTNLKEEIGKLALSIESLNKQLQLVHHLILKAELTNNQSRLVLLRKSERTLRRELEYQELLKQQYMVHEDSNSLYGRAKISIKSYLTDISSEDGKETVYYLMTVQHIFNKQLVTWDVPRRFSEFYRLNTYLRKKYPFKMRYLQTSDGFPERVKISLKYHVSKTLLYEERRRRLEHYMQELLKIREICQDEQFRKYLTDVSNTFKIKENLSDSSEIKEDQRRSWVLMKADNSVGEVTNIPSDLLRDTSELEEELDFFEDERNFYSSAKSNSPGTLVKPICELFISFFALNQSNSGWLRGRAIIVVLQRLLGSTIEKYIKDLIQRIKSPEKLSFCISKLNSIIWVDGVFFKSSSVPQPAPRTEGEINRASIESQAMLEKFMVETCGKVVGTMYASNAGYRLHAMLQNEYLNASLILEILDVIFEEINKAQSKSANP